MQHRQPGYGPGKRYVQAVQAAGLGCRYLCGLVDDDLVKFESLGQRDRNKRDAFPGCGALQYRVRHLGGGKRRSQRWNLLVRGDDGGRARPAERVGASCRERDRHLGRTQFFDDQGPGIGLIRQPVAAVDRGAAAVGVQETQPQDIAG